MPENNTVQKSELSPWIPVFLALILAAQTIIVAYLGTKIDNTRDSVVVLEKQINSNLEKQISASIAKAIAEERLKVNIENAADAKEKK